MTILIQTETTYPWQSSVTVEIDIEGNYLVIVIARFQIKQLSRLTEDKELMSDCLMNPSK